MSNQEYQWRFARLDATDHKTTKDLVAQFERAYQANNKPDGMAMFSHNDGNGFQTALSITPQSVPYCPFSDGWNESATQPRFDIRGFVAGDARVT